MILSQLNSHHVVMIILWMLYFSIHSLFASLRFKQFILLSYPGIMPWYRLIFNFLAILLLIPPVFLMLMYPGDLVWQWPGNWRYMANSLAFCRAVLQNSNFRKGNFNTSFLSKELKLHYHADPEEEILAAFFATYDYARGVHQFEEKPLRLEKSQKISPWVLKKRLR